MVSSSAQVNPMNKWRIDLGGGGSRTLIKSAASDQSLNPPGYHPGFVASQQLETTSKNEQQQQHLLSKRAWDIALGPVKALPMNMLVHDVHGWQYNIHIPHNDGGHDGLASNKGTSFRKCRFQTIGTRTSWLTDSPQNYLRYRQFWSNKPGGLQMSFNGIVAQS